jgi:hypothetical protein
MKWYDVTVWPEDDRKPYPCRLQARTSIDALLAACEMIKEAGVRRAEVKLAPDDHAAEKGR